MDSPGSSARVIQETPNSHSDQSSVSYKDWKQASPQRAHSPLPRGAIDFSTPAQSLSAWPATGALLTPPMPLAECFDETPPQPDMPPNWQAAHAEIGSFAPLGMDEKAYIAGERAGLLRAFRETLPAQRTLGELASGLSRMQIQMDNDRLHARQATTTVAELSAKLQGVQDRFRTLETVRLPDMDNRIERASTALVSKEFHLTLQAMKDAVEGAANHPSIAYTAQPGVASALVSQLTWLLGTAAGFAQKTLSKADVAAVFLSRKILLDRVSLEGTSVPAGIAASESALLHSKLRSLVRPAMGSAAFLAAVECSWQLHEQWSPILPKPLRLITAPAAYGLQAVRTATWVAAILMTAVGMRAGCFSLVDASLLAAQRGHTHLEGMRGQLLERIKQRKLLGWRQQDVELQGITVEIPSKDTLEDQDTCIVADASCCIATADDKHEEADLGAPTFSEEL
ncbi:g8978 [Coccomyxa viridis]|uniref:G8978 protein n=1 Tax=Coccomyxa viridis TaxID=1274662 RepID=A0ABP1G4A8_9CHLO